MRTWIRGGTILTPERTVEGVVILDGPQIAAIEPLSELAPSPEETRIFAADGLLVMPGLIDIHVHGGAGSDTMDATPLALETMSTFFARHGVTAFLPATISQSTAAITRAIENVAQHRESVSGALPLGVHLEGPYLSQAYRGAQAEEWLRDPDPAEYRAWLSEGVIRIITLAPELPGAVELIRAGAERGARASAGHTQASPLQVRTAVEAGLSLSTHTFNGMAGLHHRELGTAGALLADERVYCELIADGVHVHPEVAKMLLAIKGLDRTILVTDAIRATGLTDGVYDLGGQDVTVTGGVARTSAGGLAGSTLTLERAVRNMQRFAGISINQAVSLATRTPAAALGWMGKKGEIRPGADADILIADAEMNVKAVWVAGKLVYQTPELRILKEK